MAKSLPEFKEKAFPQKLTQNYLEETKIISKQRSFINPFHLKIKLYKFNGLFIVALLFANLSFGQTPISISFDFVLGMGLCNLNGGSTTSVPSDEPSNSAGLILAGQTGGWNSLLVGGGQLSNCCSTDPSITVDGITFTLNTNNSDYETFIANGSDLLRRTIVFFREDTNVSCNANPDGPPSQSMTWEFSGLDPTKAYNLILFGQSTNGNPANPADFSIIGHNAGNGVGMPVSLDSENDGNFTQVIPDNTGKISGVFSIQAGTGFSSWSGLQIQETTVLPIALSHFTAEAKDQHVLIQWETISEEHNRGFYIERSADGQSWDPINFVPGRGNSYEKQSYTFLDHSPFNGKNFYRLKQVDFDGSFEYSTIIALAYKQVGNLVQVFPNPSNGLLNLQIENASKQIMQFKIFDSLGRIIWDSPIIEGEEAWRKEISIEEEGLYFLSVRIGEKMYYQQVVISNRN